MRKEAIFMIISTAILAVGIASLTTASIRYAEAAQVNHNALSAQIAELKVAITEINDKISIDCTRDTSSVADDTVELSLQNLADPAYFGTNEKDVSLSYILRQHLCHP